MFGERMKAARITLGYSAEQVAKHLHVSPATVYRYEKGEISKMPAKTLRQLADFLCVSQGYLMEWTDDPSPKVPLKEDGLSSDEQFVMDTYRSLSDPGKQYIHQQLTIASHMFGEKSEDAGSKESG